MAIYTDGSCLENPGNGGWAAIINDNGKIKKISGNEKSTTNNRMELVAPINALKNIDSPLKLSHGSLDKFEENIENCDLLINSTSLGMEGIDANLTFNLDNSKKDLFVYDIVYSPLETNLLSSARKFNRNFTNGLGMLINQAAPAFCLFYNYNNLDNLLEDNLLYEKLEENIGA